MSKENKRKIAFLQQGVHENLGAMLLSSCLKNDGHSVALFIQTFEKHFVNKIANYEPDIICFTVLTGAHRWVRETASELKTLLPDSWIVCGGAHPTFFPKFIEEEAIDIICIGEGEGAIREISVAYPEREALENVLNLHFKLNGEIIRNPIRPLIENLDNVPFPDRALYYKYPFLRKAKRKTFLAMRGCPFNCSFCFNHQMKKLYRGKGEYLRKRSAENIIEEILRVKADYGLASVFFQDDIFILDKQWLLSFLERYRRDVAMPFTCLVRANLIDEQTVRELKESNCAGVQFGIESGNEKIRNMILRKQITNDQIINAGQLFKKHKIKFKTYNILGLPSEDMESMFDTARINMRIKTDLPWASLLMPYPKTDIADMMIQDGKLPGNYDLDNIRSTFFDMKATSRREKITLNFQRLFILCVKFPFLFPMIKQLILLPPNRIFDYIFYLSEFYVYKKSENLGWMDSLRTGYYFKKNNFGT